MQVIVAFASTTGARLVEANANTTCIKLSMHVSPCTAQVTLTKRNLRTAGNAAVQGSYTRSALHP